MRNRYRRLPLMAIILLWAVVGVARHALALTFTEFPLPGPGRTPGSITTGPDGALWFTEPGANKIGRITTAGAVTERPIPTANSRPAAITQGPDGPLCFTGSPASTIGGSTRARPK